MPEIHAQKQMEKFGPLYQNNLRIWKEIKAIKELHKSKIEILRKR